MSVPGRRAWLVPAVVTVLAVLLLGPALLPGYVLIGDLVFVPDQVLLPWMLGAGAGLPRSVPQDAVVALLTGPVPGWVWEKAALLGALVLLGTGVARLVRPAGRGAAVVAASVAVWSAYVGERLLLGHWSLLLAVGALPWALHHATAVRAGRRGAGAGWLLTLALASLTPTGGLLVLAVTGPVLVLRRSTALARGWALLATGAVLQLPWLLPALVHPAVDSVGGADVFSARAEGPWGALLTVLTTGGVWNAAAVPTSRTSWWSVAVMVGVLVVAALGARRAPDVVGRAAAGSLAVWSALGVAWCLLGAWSATAPLAAWVVDSVPGAGLLRDAQKWVAPWLVLLAVCAGLGAARIAVAATARGRDRAAGRGVLLLAAVLPLIAMPDLVLGVSGRLVPAHYPDDLAAVRSALTAEPAGDAVSLPWAAFRRFPWNDDGRTVLDPVPRAMTRTVLSSSDLVVARDEGTVTVRGDDPRATQVTAALGRGEDLGPVLAGLGVRYAVVAEDVPGGPGPLPAGATVVVRGPSFSLLRLAAPTGTVPSPSPLPGAIGLAAASCVVLVAAVERARGRRRQKA